MSELIKAGVSIGGLGAVANGFMQWTTPVLAWLGLVVALCWYASELYEGKFVQDWLAKRRTKKQPAQPQSPSGEGPTPSTPA